MSFLYEVYEVGWLCWFVIHDVWGLRIGVGGGGILERGPNCSISACWCNILGTLSGCWGLESIYEASVVIVGYMLS